MPKARIDKLKNGSFAIRWNEYVTGKRVNPSVTVAEYEDAIILAGEIQRSLNEKGFWRKRDTVNQTLHELIEMYLESIDGDVRAKTWREKRRVLYAFAELCRGKRTAVDASALTLMNVKRFYNTIKGELGVDTRYRYMGHIHTCWKDLFNWIGDPIPHPRHIKLPRAGIAASHAPTWTLLDQFIHECNGEKMYRAAVLSRFLGLRASTICALTWDMFRLNACVLEMPEDLPGSKTRQGREAKTIPISKHLAQHMAGWGVREGKVAGLNGVASHNWKSVWDRVAAAEYDEETRRDIEMRYRGQPSKAFRKTFITGLKKLNADVESVNYLVGHRLSVNAREHYLDPTGLNLVETVALIPDITPARSLRVTNQPQLPLSHKGGRLSAIGGAPDRIQNLLGKRKQSAD